MSGHSKWATIKHKKGIADAKRGQAFTKLIKEITVCAKMGGPDPESNARLRTAILKARAENMPKDNIERAIKKATDKTLGDFKEVTFEGYGPFGVAFLVETATDNNTRTVANVRSYFTKCGGTLGTSGSVSFMFGHKCVFRIKDQEGIDVDELQLNLCDYDDPEVFVEEQEDELVSGGFERIPNTELKDVTPEQRETLNKLTDLLENDDDVTNVYSLMKPAEE